MDGAMKFLGRMLQGARLRWGERAGPAECVIAFSVARSQTRLAASHWPRLF